MSASRELLDWSDLYGKIGGAPTKPAPNPACEPRLTVPPLTGIEHSTAGSGLARDSSLRGSPSASQARRGSTPRRIEQLAQPQGRGSRPVEPRTPNYGTLLSFSEEEHKDDERREKWLNTPRKVAEKTPRHTTPATTPRLERLAQPRRPPQPVADHSWAADLPDPRSRRYDPADPSTFDRLAQPRQPPRANVLGMGSCGQPGEARVRSRSTPANAIRPDLTAAAGAARAPRSVPYTTAPPKDTRKARMDTIDSRLAAYRSQPKHSYSGPAQVEYSPTLPARAPPVRGRRGQSQPRQEPAWENMQRPRPAVVPARDLSAYRHDAERRECERLQAEQRAKAAAAAPAGPVVVRSEPVAARQPPPAATADPPKPKPPLEVRTKRFQPAEDGPAWPPPPPPHATVSASPSVAVVAVRRGSTATPGAGGSCAAAEAGAAEGAAAGASCPPAHARARTPAEAVPVALAVRRAKPTATPAPPPAVSSAGETTAAAGSPLIVQCATLVPPLEVSGAVVTGAPATADPRSSSPPVDGSKDNGALGQRVSVSTPRRISLEPVYKAPPSRPQPITVTRESSKVKR